MGSMLKYLYLLLRIVVVSSACERVLIAVHSKYPKRLKNVPTMKSEYSFSLA